MQKKRLAPPLRFLMAARQRELGRLEALTDLSRLVDLISQLVHGLQKERGLSNALLCDVGDTMLAEVAAQARDSAAIEAEVRAAWDCLIEPSGPAEHASVRLLSAVAHALQQLEQLETLREQVRRRAIAAEAATSRYTGLLGALLAIVFELADTAVDADVTRALVALLNFIQGKELCGQERACGVIGFLNGYFTDERKAQMQALAQAQERCFDAFLAHGGPRDADAQAWRSVGELTETLARLRTIAARTDAGQQVDRQLSAAWFAAATARIDAMHHVERKLIDELARLCQARITSMREELADHRVLLDQLSSADPRDGAGRVFNVQARPLNALPDDPLGAGLQASVLDMLARQTARLADSEHQLAQARKALEERKYVERAKWVLVAALGVTEKDAHDQLQKTAMNTGQPLQAVAREVIDKLGGKRVDGRKR
ncbi:nitrate- and nitrite sensing domain-containing protein [Achromobacter aloeverae]|uniref:Antitermination regulator n=1 Tax=Achromobacter aloeverae TaxID=1750518 RepID=A0A4Q1HM15_9BURK|nr:nitrate- and nitrite sensing domain-containing protein [Achromobacter aloeverae]RXN90548.1 antitermination regulator [Achromobacter aloeverae]